MENIYGQLRCIFLVFFLFQEAKTELSVYYTDITAGNLYHRMESSGGSSVKEEVLTLPFNTSIKPVAFSYDQENDVLYWSDILSNQIVRMHSNGSNYQVLFTGVHSDGMAWEPIGRLLFWTDLDRKTVGVSRPDYNLNMTIIKTGLDKPRDVEVYSEKGWLFLTDWGSSPKVEQMTMCGTQKETISGSTPETTVSWPNGLTIDHVEEKLYYVDARLDKMLRYDFTTKKTQLILKYGSGVYLMHPFGLTMHKEELYWTDWIVKGIVKANKRYGNGVTIVRRNLLKPGDIHAYEESNETDYKRIYKYAYPSTKCENQCKGESLAQITLPNCPSGFKAVRDDIACHICIFTSSAATGKRCPCTSWSSCAHRIEEESPCSSSKAYLHLGVRECVQTTRGLCAWSMPELEWELDDFKYVNIYDTPVKNYSMPGNYLLDSTAGNVGGTGRSGNDND